jgi:DNA-binding MarR family transcriptional regulator
MIADERFEDKLARVKLTRSQGVVLDILRKRGKDGVTPKQLIEQVSFAPRTVRYALRKLLKFKLIRRIPCLLDMRQWIYLPL